MFNDPINNPENPLPQPTMKEIRSRMSIKGTAALNKEVEAELEMPDPIEEIAFGAGGKSSLEFSNQQNQQSRLSPEDREQLEEFEDMDMQERMEYLNNKNKS
jgi:hypothetical protein|tara:strand:+ start:361 stop:666 length:306 start_codon:yes stop_codon:yes gene_type:complete